MWIFQGITTVMAVQLIDKTFVSLATDKLGIDKSTYGRMESGATKTVSSDILIKLSELYNVTTDYILGISDVPESRSAKFKQ